MALEELSPENKIKHFKKMILPLLATSEMLERAQAVKKLAKILEVSAQTINDEIRAVTGENSTEKNQSEILIEIALSNMLFHDELEEPYTLIKFKGHSRIIKVGQDRDFVRYISNEYYKKTGLSPCTESIKQAINIAESKAIFEGKQHKLALRVASGDNAFWYDLADVKGRAVKITSDGWQVMDEPPILFRRRKNQEKQVEPIQTGDIWKLADFVNIDNDGLKLLIVYLISCLIPNIPHPIAIFHGEKGASKSTTMQFIRRLIDPSKREIFAFMPKDHNELTQQLYANYAPCYDNLSGLSQMQSNLLCGASGGSGASKRKLHTDTEDVILNFFCCPVLNGVNLVAGATDLLDRSLIFELERIGKENRREAVKVFAAFEEARPAIFTGFLDILSRAMKLYPEVELTPLPRMADFFKWGFVIAEAAGFGGDNFIDVYNKNLNLINLAVLETNPVATAIITFMGDKTEVNCTMTELLKELNKAVVKLGIDTKSSDWPKAPESLSRKLTAIKSNLYEMGIKYNNSRNAKGAQVALSKI